MKLTVSDDRLLLLQRRVDSDLDLGALVGCVGPSSTAPSRTRRCSQTSDTWCRLWWEKSLVRLWLAFMNSHSLSAASTPRRRKPCQPRFSL